MSVITRSGSCSATAACSPGGVSGHRDDVKAEPLQQPGQAFPQQDPVLGQDYPDPPAFGPGQAVQAKLRRVGRR
jgi:hypothetical protein